MTDVDTIVIGSGAGGLTAAVALARAGQRVAVFEQHYLPGGWCHSFPLGGYRFSPGVHYIGDLAPGRMLRNVYEGLGLGGDLSFFELNPDGYDHVRVAGEQFDYPAGRERLIARLSSRFPDEREGIGKFFDAVRGIAKGLDAVAEFERPSDLAKIPLRAPSLLRWGVRSAQSMIEHYVRDPKLRAILSAQAGDHGLPPSRAPAVVHATVMAHYFDGGYYPRGGAYTIPRAFIRGLRRAGGEIHVKTPVAKILVERGRAIGVRLGDGTEVRARNVISNADPGVTFGKLIDREHHDRRIRWHLRRTRYSTSAISLFLAVDMDLRARGVDSGNYWHYDHTDVDAIYRLGLTDQSMQGEIPGLFVTVTTLKDPTKQYGGHHTLEAFSFVPYGPFRRWAHTKFGERPADYTALKAELTQRMLRAVGKVIPGIEKHVVFCDLGTPLTNDHYVAATLGNLYGTEKSLAHVGPFAWPLASSIQGLWMCGASTLSHGVAGATISGLFAAKHLLGASVDDLLRGGGPSITLRRSDDVVNERRRVNETAVALG